MTAQRIRTTETLKIYRARSSYGLTLYYLSGLFFSAIGLFLTVYLIQQILHKGFLSWSDMLPLIVFAVVVFITVKRIGQIMQTTYLLLTDEGIEYQSGGKTVIASWKEVVELIDRPSPTLVVSANGRSYVTYLMTKNPKDDPYIPLYLFQYSPNSELAKDLRKYAPHLF